MERLKSPVTNIPFRWQFQILHMKFSKRKQNTVWRCSWGEGMGKPEDLSTTANYKCF